MKTKTVEEIINRARQWADAETDDGTVDFETDTELLDYLNESWEELVDEILENDGLDLLIQNIDLLDSTIPPYGFDDIGVYRTVAAEVQNGNDWIELPRFMFANRNVYSSTQFPAWRVMNGAIVLYPTTAAPALIRLWIVPDATTFAAADDVPVFGGWSTFLSTRIAMKMLTKEERHSEELENEFKLARKRVQRACRDLHLGSPEQQPQRLRVVEDLYDDAIPEALPRP